MVNIVKRLVKGSALTFEEMDGNLEEIKNEINIRPTVEAASISIINAVLNLKDNVPIYGDNLNKLYNLSLDLNEKKIEKESIVNAYDSTDSTKVLSALKGKELKDSLNSEITNRINSVFNETVRASNVENTLRTSLNTEVTNRTNAIINENADRVANDNAEVTNRTNAINNSIIALKDGVAVEGDTLNKLNTLINSSEIRKINYTDVVNTLTNIETNKPLSAAQGKILKDSLDSEIVNRISSTNNTETTFNNYILSEANTRLIADTLETTNRNIAISNEVSVRQTENAVINVRIDNILNNTDASALDSLSELVTAFQNADSNLTTSINNLSSTAASNLNAEITNRTNAITTEITDRIANDNAEITNRTNAITTESNRAIGVENTLTSSLNAEVTNRIAAIINESNRAINAENTLTSSLNAEVTNRTNAITTESNRAIGAESTLTSSLNAEITNRTNAINSAINTEVTNRNTADTIVQTNAANDATNKANAAQTASTPISHIGTNGTSHAIVTTAINGFMMAADKVKLDAISGINTGDQTNISGNAITATKLQTVRTINGIAFDGTANIFNTEWIHSGRDFPLGTTIITSINYSLAAGNPYVLEIKGNSYGSSIPFDIQCQGYIYSNSIINHGGYSNGTNVPGIVALNVGGFLTFWFPNGGYWQGFNVKVYTAQADNNVNRVTSITNSAKPVGTKEVDLSLNIKQSWHTGNLTNLNQLANGPEYINAASSITGNAASATILQISRTINGINFNGSANISINAVDSTSRIAATEKGIANGVATLDGNGLVPANQLPSYVDDVLEFSTLGGFSGTGVTGKIYVALDTNKTYRWSGSGYIYITSGAVDSVAGKTGIVSLIKSDVGLDNVDNTSDSNKSVNYAASAGNANTVGGLSISPDRNNTPNKIVKTDANGYLQVGYVNSSHGNENNNANADRVWGTNGTDDYLRTYRTSALSVGYANSSGSSNTSTLANSLLGFRVLANIVNSDDKGVSGINYFSGGTNNPYTDGALYQQSYPQAPTTWGSQIQQDYRTGKLAVRGLNSGAWSAWLNIIDSGNIGIQSVSYADSAGNSNTSNRSVKFDSSSHPGTYWLINNWDGTHWDVTSNHGAGVKVNYANSAGSAAANDVYTWAKQSVKPSYNKNEIGLSNVDNTADSNKSVNYATSSGSATNATNLTGVALTAGYSIDGGDIGYNGPGGPQVMGNTTTAAMQSFHRAGAYAVNFGLDTDNQLKVGGWSMGAGVKYTIIHSGNFSSYASVAGHTHGGQSGTLYQGFTLDANTMVSGGQGFTYSLNAPHTGPILSSAANGYDLQLNSGYTTTGLSFRSKNGDNGSWNAWQTIIHSANIGNQSVNYANSAGTSSSCSGNSGSANQLQAFTGDDFTGGSHYVKAIRGGGWGMRLKTCYFNGASTTNDISVAYADTAGSASANDVSAWAKAVTKPSYSASEINALPINGGTMTGPIAAKRIEWTGNGGDSGNSFGANHYAMGQDGGSWSHPYPDLIIGFHTGIRFGAMPGYGGMRFYNNSPTTGNIGGEREVFSVANGDDNVRAVETIYAKSYRGNANISGTGEATHHPAGIFSTGTNWLYGQIITANNSIDAGTGTVTAGSVNTGSLTVGGGGASSYIYMNDSDEGQRILHCNSNQIGFLTQAGSWGASCDDVGNWIVAGAITGSNLSGTNTGDQINISGNAATATGATFQNSNVAGTSCLTVFQNTPAGSISSRECNSWGDAPNAGWWVIQSIRHTNVSNIWGTQLAYGWEDNGNAIYQRNVSGGTWSGWTRVDVSLANITELVNNAGFITAASIPGSLPANGGNASTVSSWQSITARTPLDYNLAGRTNGSYACEVAGTNGPGPAYLNLIHQVGSGDVGFQIAGGYVSDAMFFRGSSGVQNGTGYTPWRTVIHSGTIGSQSVNYANTANNATTAGSAAKLTGQANTNGSDGWFRSSGACGWYSTDYAVGIYATEATNVRTYNNANFISGGNITAYSDERLKKDWASLAQDFLLKLSDIKYGTYTRVDTELRQVGVSAQELQKILPEAVMGTGEGKDYLSVAYGNAALVVAVELSKEVIQLKSIIADQESRLQKLEALLIK